MPACTAQREVDPGELLSVSVSGRFSASKDSRWTGFSTICLTDNYLFNRWASFTYLRSISSDGPG